MEEGEDKPSFKRHYGSAEPWHSEVYKNHKEIKWKRKSNVPSMGRILLYAGLTFAASAFLAYYGCSIKKDLFSESFPHQSSLETTLLS